MWQQVQAVSVRLFASSAQRRAAYFQESVNWGRENRCSRILVETDTCLQVYISTRVLGFNLLPHPYFFVVPPLPNHRALCGWTYATWSVPKPNIVAINAAARPPYELRLCNQTHARDVVQFRSRTVKTETRECLCIG